MISGLTELAEVVVDRTIALSVVPAPPGAEARRAETVSGWWRSGQLATLAATISRLGEQEW